MHSELWVWTTRPVSTGASRSTFCSAPALRRSPTQVCDPSLLSGPHWASGEALRSPLLSDWFPRTASRYDRTAACRPPPALLCPALLCPALLCLYSVLLYSVSTPSCSTLSTLFCSTLSTLFCSTLSLLCPALLCPALYCLYSVLLYSVSTLSCSTLSLLGLYSVSTLSRSLSCSGQRVTDDVT